MGYEWALVPVISAFIGWLANRVAITLLFYPRRPIKLLGLRIRGVFPRKQEEFAGKLAKLLSNELLSFRDIEEKFTQPGSVKRIMPQVEEHIDHFLRIKLPAQMPVISMFIGDKTIQELKTVFTAEMEELFPVVMKNYINGFREELTIENMVTDRVRRFSSSRLEELFRSALTKEFRSVELLGAGLGFLVGLVLVLVMSVLNNG
jgi:uncharacterized membrane protein YheB (UPF0754 family)